MSDFDVTKNVAVFDIEATDLEAQHGYMLGACIKKVNKDNLLGYTKTITILDSRNRYGVFNDKWVVQEVIKELNKYDLVIGWNSSGYDFPFTNTRAIIHRINPPLRNYRRDILFNSRGSLRLKNNRLATVGEALYGESGKIFLKWAVWIKAKQGDRKAIKQIMDHCEADVVETEKVYKSMIPILGKLRKR